MSNENENLSALSGVELIAEERQRQISVEGWTSKHDDEHVSGDMALAAACYAVPNFVRISQPIGHTKTIWDRLWPWTRKWWKPTPQDRIRELVKAGALISAEIDRLQRSARAYHALKQRKQMRYTAVKKSARKEAP